MAMTIYRWDDASAPTLNGNSGGYAIISVLSACLVDGYGSKSAAGWTKPYTGTGKAVFKQGIASASDMHLRVDASSSSQYPRVLGYEVMTGVDTGTGPFPTEVQLSGGGYLATSSTADTTSRPWLIAADDSRFFLWIGHDNTTAAGLTSSTYKMVYFFGDIVSYKTNDAYACLLSCSSSGAVSANSFGSTANLTAISGHFLARSYTQIGSSITASKTHDSQRAGGATNIGTSGTTYPDAVTGGLIMQPILVGESAAVVIRGHLPGVWAPLHNLPGASGDTFSGTGSLAGKTFLLLDASAASVRCRIILETSDTWS